MAPLEVLMLLCVLHFIEITIILMLLLEINTVRMIFVTVPRMVVVAVAILVAFFVRISLPYNRAGQGGAQHQRAQN
jgi:hypothetical protein